MICRKFSYDGIFLDHVTVTGRRSGKNGREGKEIYKRRELPEIKASIGWTEKSLFDF